MIHESDSAVPNLDIVGLMVRDRHSSNLSMLDMPDCPCYSCEGILAEAWERMTFGGMFIKNHSSIIVLHHQTDDAWYLDAAR